MIWNAASASPLVQYVGDSSDRNIASPYRGQIFEGAGGSGGGFDGSGRCSHRLGR